MNKLYNYRIYKQDGTIEEIGPRKRMGLKELQTSVNGRIEVLPQHFKKLFKNPITGHWTAFINEEGKFDGSIENPHINPYHLDAKDTITGEPWDDWITGDIIVEQVAH